MFDHKLYKFRDSDGYNKFLSVLFSGENPKIPASNARIYRKQFCILYFYAWIYVHYVGDIHMHKLYEWRTQLNWCSVILFLYGESSAFCSRGKSCASFE
jgi:hypothetical protein